MTPEQLAQLREKAEKATPGPWTNTPMLTVVAETVEIEPGLEFTGIPIVVQPELSQTLKQGLKKAEHHGDAEFQGWLMKLYLKLQRDLKALESAEE